MAIHYTCRHCFTNLGVIEDKQVSSDTLGFNELTTSERLEMVTYESNGDMKVDVICEDCHESLTRNPEFYELDRIIQ